MSLYQSERKKKNCYQKHRTDQRILEGHQVHKILFAYTFNVIEEGRKKRCEYLCENKNSVILVDFGYFEHIHHL